LVYAVLLNKRLNSEKRSAKNSEVDERRRSMKVSRVTSFMPPKYSAFYEVLRTAMPANYVIMPNVAIELLFQRAYRPEIQMVGQYADFCIFTEKFVPALVIELRDYSTATDTVFHMDDKVRDIIRGCGIAVMEYDVRDTYSIDDLRRTIAKAMNPLFRG
jgi:hypothetical protein